MPARRKWDSKEKNEDFRKRLELVLNNPEDPWPPIDPEGWVVQRNYNNRKRIWPSFYLKKSERIVNHLMLKTLSER
jgi:hypothetical protein